MSKKLPGLHDLHLTHYSRKRLRAIRSRKQVDQFKPCGLWVSVDNEPEESWPAFCVDTLGIAGLAYTTRIYLAKDANVLHLRNRGEILRFTQEYLAEDDTLPDMLRRSMYLDWDRVAEKYDGLVVAPYCYQARLDPDTFWYYGWDCAGGCIWEKRAIERVGPSERVPWSAEDRLRDAERERKNQEYLETLMRDANKVPGVRICKVLP